MPRILECKRCGHRWIPQVLNPKQCPACHNKYWNKEYVRSDKVLGLLDFKGFKE